MKSLLLAPLVAAVFTMNAGAALIAYQDGSHGLGGNVSYQGWNRVTLTAYNPTTNPTSTTNNNAVTPGNNNTRPYNFHNLQNAWVGPIASNLGTGTSNLNKTSGYGYIASGSLHQGAQTNDILPGGSFTVSGTTISGIQTLIFQISATDRNEAIFSAGGVPTLTIGGGVLTAEEADFSRLYGTIDNFVGTGQQAQDLDFYTFQWDLSGLVIPDGASYSVAWTGLVNSGIYELQVNQSDIFTQVVPEPSTGLLGAGALCLAFIRRRRA